MLCLYGIYKNTMTYSVDNETNEEAKCAECDNDSLIIVEDIPSDCPDDLVYSIEDVPPWYMCILLGLQQFLTMFGPTLTIPFVISAALCTQNEHSVMVDLISTITFVSGIVTILQITLGVRLPIVQGGTYTFLIPTLAILTQNKWNCPSDMDRNMTYSGFNGSNGSTSESQDSSQIWQYQMREVQGAIIVASVCEVFIALTGLIGYILPYIGPLTIAPTISLIGLSLFDAAAARASTQWYIALMTMVLIALFSQYLSRVSCSAKVVKNVDGKPITTTMRIPVLGLFPILLAMVLSWVICGVLTATNLLGTNPGDWGYEARTDTKALLVSQAGWFRVPYPGQWGRPTVSAGAAIGMLAGFWSSMVESVGDYYACAKLSGAPRPPPSAINRGLLIEGIGCILAGAWGTGNGTTSYSQNVGAIGLTKVGSRRVIFYCAIIMLLVGCITKFNAVVASMPEPILGGALIIIFGMIVSTGLSNLQTINMSSSRNSFIIGTSLFFGLSFPYWVTKHGSIETGNTEVDQILIVMCSTSTFVGGLVGFVLDNTIPGTKEERGLLAWQHARPEAESRKMTTYDIPFLQKYINRSWLRRLPIFEPNRTITKDIEDLTV